MELTPLKAVRDAAQRAGYKLLTKVYTGAHVSLEIQCLECGTKATALLANLRGGRACVGCAHRAQWQRLRDLCSAMGAKLLQNHSHFETTETRFSVRCSCGVTFTRRYDDMIWKGGWCPCGVRSRLESGEGTQEVPEGRRSWEDLRAMASKKGFTVRLDAGEKGYTNWATRCVFVCGTCNGELRRPASEVTRINCQHGATTLESIRLDSYNRLLEIMKQRGGELLTPFDDFKNLKDKVEIRCSACEETWSPAALSIVNLGTWCPNRYCARLESVQKLRVLSRRIAEGESPHSVAIGEGKDPSNFMKSLRACTDKIVRANLSAAR